MFYEIIEQCFLRQTLPKSVPLDNPNFQAFQARVGGSGVKLKNGNYFSFVDFFTGLTCRGEC